MTGVDNDSVLFEVMLIVPKGLGLDAASAANPNLSDATITLKTGVSYDTVIYAKTSYHYGDEYEIPLNLYNSSNFIDGEKISLEYSTRISCKPCFSQTIHCGTIPSTRVHLLPPCTGPRTSAVNSKRITAGWTDFSKTAKVVLDEEVHKVDSYLPFDTMQIDIQNAIIDTTLDNLYLQVEYIAESGGGADTLLSFLSGEITIKDFSSATTGTGAVSIPPVITDLSNGNYNITFDLSSYTSLISPSCLLYTSPSPRDA